MGMKTKAAFKLICSRLKRAGHSMSTPSVLEMKQIVKQKEFEKLINPLEQYNKGFRDGAMNMFNAIHGAMMALKKDCSL